MFTNIFNNFYSLKKQKFKKSLLTLTNASKLPTTNFLGQTPRKCVLKIRSSICIRNFGPLNEPPKYRGKKLIFLPQGRSLIETLRRNNYENLSDRKSHTPIFGWDLAECLDHLTAIAKVATVWIQSQHPSTQWNLVRVAEAESPRLLPGKLNNISTPFLEQKVNNIIANVDQKVLIPTFFHNDVRTKRSPYKMITVYKRAARLELNNWLDLHHLARSHPPFC